MRGTTVSKIDSSDQWLFLLLTFNIKAEVKHHSHNCYISALYKRTSRTVKSLRSDDVQVSARRKRVQLQLRWRAAFQARAAATGIWQAELSFIHLSRYPE